MKGELPPGILIDHLGSVRLVVDEDAGAIPQRIDYDTWGFVTAASTGFIHRL